MASSGGDLETQVLNFSPWDPEKGSKLCQGRFTLDMRNHFLTKNGETLNKLPREMVDALDLLLFKRRLDCAFNNTL